VWCCVGGCGKERGGIGVGENGMKEEKTYGRGEKEVYVWVWG